MSSPPRAVAVTLEDGFQDNYEHAFPMLRQEHIPATIFVATGLVGKTNVWMRERGLPEPPMLSWAQVGEMSEARIAVGAHSVTHPRLPDVNDTQIRRELVDSRQAIEARLGKLATYFAYPFGLLSPGTRELVRETG